MQRLIVNVSKLNRRNRIPSAFPDKDGIAGVVHKGFMFEGREVPDVPNPSLGRWFVDRDSLFYWGGGLVVEPVLTETIRGLPMNLPTNHRIGIDVSHHNARPDWTAFRDAGVSFVYIKTS